MLPPPLALRSEQRWRAQVAVYYNRPSGVSRRGSSQDSGKARMQKEEQTKASSSEKEETKVSKTTRYVENNFYNKRRVATWRGTEAIEVMALSHNDLEWSEFVHNSRENLQDKLERLYADNPVQLARKIELAHHETVEYQEAAKEYRMPRLHVRLVAHDGTVVELNENDKKIISPQSSSSSHRGEPGTSPHLVRSLFDPNTFRYRKEIGVVFSRVPPPDPVLNEDNLAEIETAKPETDKAKVVRDRLHLKKWVESWFSSTSGDDLSGRVARSTAAKDKDDSVSEIVGVEGYRGAVQLKVRTEYMNKVHSDERMFATPANADRVDSWEVPENLVNDKIVFALEPVQLPSEHIAEVPEQTPDKVQSSLLGKALIAPHTALIADRILASWGAFSIRIPSHVTQGPYRIRLHGYSKNGD